MATNQLSGTIYDAHNAAFQRVTIQAFDQDFRKQEQLGETTTDENGNYMISYDTSRYAVSENGSADIFIRVLDTFGAILGQSDVHFNAPDNLVLDFKIGNTPVRTLNEFDNLVNKIKPLIEPQRVSIGEFQEDDQYNDISFLAGELGEDIKRITFLNIAFKLSKETHIAPEIFFGLFRMSFPVDLNALLQIKADSILKALKQAIDENIISSIWSDELESTIKVLNRLAVKHVLDENNENSATFRKVMGSVLSTDQQKIFVDTWVASELKPEEFWEQLKLQPGFTDGRDIEKSKQALHLNLITANQPELTNQLLKAQDRDNELKSVYGLTKLDKADWKEQIKNAGIDSFPVWVSGTSPEEKSENYAALLEQLHKELYPTVFFASRLKKDQQSSFPLKQELESFFSNNPEFDLKTNKIQKQFEGANFDSISDVEGLKTELKSLSRLYKLTGEYEEVNALYGNKLYSAGDIVNKYGEEQFTKQFESTLGGTNNASEIYKRAVSINNKATALLMAFWGTHNSNIYAINCNNPVPEGYHKMFGDGELCECEHCQSVYSPAAYFVDMLAFIKDKNEEAFNELLRRRPDLDDILLTCKNTNTPLPYIDLVNELLEKKVINLSNPGMTPNPEDNSFQTKGISEELAAMPEHLSESAYEYLNSVNENSVFSPLLPLDLPLEELRIYTEKLGWKRYELMESLYGHNEPGKLNDPELAKELFRFSDEEFKIINGSTPLTVTIPQKNSVKAFLDKTKLSYIELLQLLETYFLNEKRLIKITQPLNNEGLITCNLEKLIVSGVDDEWMNKMSRFVRLWKKLGWEIFDLDRTLVELIKKNHPNVPLEFPATSTSFNDEILVPLSHIERIKRLLNVSVREALTFFANIDTAIYIDHSKEGQPIMTSLYDQIFRNKTVAHLDNSPFKENGEGLSGELVNQQDAICAVLGISAADFALMNQEGESLSLESLSRLYRNTLLAKTLRNSINELLRIIDITGFTPADGVWSTLSLLVFLDEYMLFKSTGIQAYEFQTIISKKNEDAYSLPVDEALIVSVNQVISELETILVAAGITDIQRKKQFEEKLDSFIVSLNGHAPLMVALAGTLNQNHDMAVKKEIENYSEANKEQLFLLSPNELIGRLNSLRTLLMDYLSWKSTPLILKKFGFDITEIRWLKTNGPVIKIAVLWDNNINIGDPAVYHAFRNLFFLTRLGKIKTDTLATSWIDLLDIAIGLQNQTKSDFFDAFINLYKVTENSLIFLAGSRTEINNKGRLNLTFREDYYQNAEFLFNILDGCKLIDDLGGNVEQFQALVKGIVKAEDAQGSKNLLKSKYSNKEWIGIIKSINDQLRTRRRDALVAWLLAKNNTQWKSANDIYKDLLIDVEMDSCMVTSRIKQAIGSVQLFIDMCLMNLEMTLDTQTTDPDDVKTIFLGSDFSKQWYAWRKLEQYWTANRKVFLYPENWIEPELRDGKSPFFKELESQLKQNEVTEESAKEALLTYLGKLDTVANLEVIGLFNDEQSKIVHVIGRTLNIPHQYFYRRQIESHWTAWEKVEGDIEGDHILPVVWNGRLILFWALFIEKQETGGDTTITPKAGGSMTMNSVPTPKFLEMKLAWSEYKKGKWGAKKLSKDAIKCQNLLFDNDHLINGLEERDGKKNIDYLSLNSSFDNGNLLVHLFYLLPENEPFNKHFKVKGSFLFNNCNSSPSLTENYQNIAAKIPSVMLYNKMFIDGLVQNNMTPFSLYLSGAYMNENSNLEPTEVPIFSKIPSSFHLSPDHHEIEKDKAETFFYKNEAHNFYAYSKEVRRPIAGDYSVDNAGVLMTKKTVTPISNSAPLITNSNGTPTSISRIIGDVVNTDRLGEWKNEVIGPTKVFLGKKYLFQTFYHPYVCNYIKILNTKSIDDLYTEEVQTLGFKEIFIQGGSYDPTAYVLTPYPKEELDFNYSGSYSLYNWELFFHIPLLIATRLSQNQKFEEARKWFHYIFNPTKSSNNETGAERFWITKPFKQEVIDQKANNSMFSLEELLENKELVDDLNAQLNNWENNPFNPHAVARLRVSAYMRNTVLKYIDNLIAWGDQLFKRDTIESINEATLLYTLASNILGKKLEKVPSDVKLSEQSFKTIAAAAGLDRFSNAKVEVESFISPSLPNESGENIRMAYFCLPKNDNLLKYWDTVSDRLFKIRHCQNIEGGIRQLQLFERAIDPGLLVRATTAGLDLSSILNEVNISLPYYRFPIMLQKANELCNDVKMLGGSLLSALEKKDAEELAVLRSGHELRILEMIRDVKVKQRDEAQENLESLLSSRVIVEERFSYYNKNASAYLNASEKSYFDLTNQAIGIQKILELKNYLSSIAALTPNFKIGSGFTIGTTFGGENLERAEAAASNALQSIASLSRLQAESANMKGSFDRRMDEWKFQSKSAELELKQIDKQIVAAEIRLSIAEKEIENHNLQMEQSAEVYDYMRSKFTNAELYDWMVSQLSTAYFQSYQLAYTTAKKAEKCLQYELGLQATNYVQFGYWDSLKKGLLSGEKLQFDLRRLENAYLEANKREYEIVKQISLEMLDPLALIQLKSLGNCSFEIPEVLYDMDHAGQYFRRLKSVSISIPCVAGPYTAVSATLSQTSGKYRPDDDVSSEYIDSTARIKSIATSHAQNDSGLFELNFRDERYLPFEGAGAISSWQLELPQIIRQFDYNTISDVIVHIKYTAWEGSTTFKKQVNDALTARLNEVEQQLGEQGLHIAINMKHDLPNEWHLLKENGTVELNMDKSRLPYMAQTLNPSIEKVIFVAKVQNDPPTFAITFNDDDTPSNLSKIEEWEQLNLLKVINSNISLGTSFRLSASVGELKYLEELMMVVKYRFEI